jgi:hypothetical protein
MREEVKKNPLVDLLGTWKGDMGTDLAPKPVEDENNPYYEVLTIEPVDIEVENAQQQQLTAVRYHQIVREKANDEVSHCETGFWMWDNNEDTIMCAFSIPRGASLLSGGTVRRSGNQKIILEVSSRLDDPNWGIVQSPFLESKAKILSFKREIELSGNKLTYTQETSIDIYGKIFNHKDNNTLKKVE